MENLALNNILTRSSVRTYLPDRQIQENDIELILKAGMAAPSAVNRQPWQFVVVRDKSTLRRLADSLPYAKMAAHASTAIIPCGDKKNFLEGIDDSLGCRISLPQPRTFFSPPMLWDMAASGRVYIPIPKGKIRSGRFSLSRME